MCTLQKHTVTVHGIGAKCRPHAVQYTSSSCLYCRVKDWLLCLLAPCSQGFGDSPDLSDNMLLQPSGLGLANSRHRLESEPSSSDAAGTSNSNANGTNGNGHGSTFGSVAHVNEPKAGWFSWFSSGSSGTAAVAGAPGRDAGSPLGYTLRPGVGGEEGSILPLGHMHNASLRPKQGRTQAARLSDSELAEVEVVRRLVESYFDIVRKSVSDQVRAFKMCVDDPID